MKNHITTILSLLIVASLSSQELDEDFLDSLPDDIKKDLIDKNTRQGVNAKENYKPYLYSSKLSQAEEFIDLKERLELDLLELERRISLNENLDASEGLKLYGSDFFDTFQTSFMPINEPNPVSDYSLDIGDVLNIQLVGQLDNIDDYIINGDGSISIEEIVR